MTRRMHTPGISLRHTAGDEWLCERRSQDWTVLWALFGLTVAKYAVERPQPVAAIGFLSQPLCPQQFAQLPVGADDAERDTAGRQFVMKIVQHARPRQIDIGRGRQIACHKP